MDCSISTVVNTPSDEQFPVENGSNEKPSLRYSSTSEYHRPSPVLTLLPEPHPKPSIATPTNGENAHALYSDEDGTTLCVPRISWTGAAAMGAGVFQQMLCWGLIMTHGTILSYYSRFLMPQVSKTLLCLVGAIPALFVLGLSLLWGRLLDAGHHRKTNIFAGLCITAGLSGLAFTGGEDRYGDGHYWAILLASILIGFGQSCYFLTAPHVAKSWHPNRKGFAMGVTNSGASLGGVVWPFAFTGITGKYGFKAGVGTLAGIAAFLATFIAFASVPGPGFKCRPLTQPLNINSWIPREALRSKTFLIHTSAMCLIYLGVLTVPFLIEYWAQQRHIGVSEDKSSGTGIKSGTGDLTVYLVVILNACQLPGRLFGSAVCDYFSARRVHAVACLTFVLLVGSLWPVTTSYGAAGTFAGLLGSTLGIMASLPINDVQDILGHNRTALLGQYAGLVYTIASPFIFTGAVIAGALVDNAGVVYAGIYASSAIFLGAVFIILSLQLEDDTWKFDRPSRSNSFGFEPYED